ncbi:DNA repair and recombination protein rti1 [Pelomyxa schiedti]|nr:DNA repair and recombination protein rti1 [Pelomyxa schiedti]
MFGEVNFTETERREVGAALQKMLGPDQLCFREAASFRGDGKSKIIAYLNTDKAIDLANQVFGMHGWSSSIKSIGLDTLEQVGESKWIAGCSAIVRIQLKDGTYHEDVGYGVSDGVSKLLALECAKKMAASDAFKRALRMFGNFLGNSAYSDAHVEQVLRAKMSSTTPTTTGKS